MSELTRFDHGKNRSHVHIHDSNVGWRFGSLTVAVKQSDPNKQHLTKLTMEKLSWGNKYRKKSICKDDKECQRYRNIHIVLQGLLFFYAQNFESLQTR